MDVEKKTGKRWDDILQKTLGFDQKPNCGDILWMEDILHHQFGMVFQPRQKK
jgi:hypothetical protein